VTWPRYRTGTYAIWHACERLGIRPPEVKSAWDDNGVQIQAMILAYDQIRDHDEHEREVGFLKSMRPK